MMRIAARRSLSGVKRVKSRKLRVNGIIIASVMIPMITARRMVRRRFKGLAIE